MAVGMMMKMLVLIEVNFPQKSIGYPGYSDQTLEPIITLSGFSQSVNFLSLHLV
jgi:hypothetical protein